ncbi:hypothetical protein WA158_004725 [Blastocystis sp. Blastoise]
MDTKRDDLESASLIEGNKDIEKEKKYTERLICGCLPASIMKQFLVCLFYASCSILLSLVNKSVLSSYHFKSPFCLALFQQCGAAIVCGLLGLCGVISLPPAHKIFNKQAIFVSVAFVSNTVCGFMGLQLVDIPMFLTLRRLTTLFALVGEMIFLHQYQPANVVLSLCVIMVGTLIAGYSTLSISFYFNNYILLLLCLLLLNIINIYYYPLFIYNNITGVLYTLSNNVLTALYLNLNNIYIYVASYSKNTGIRSIQLMFVNSVLSIPTLAVVSMISGEFTSMLHFEGWAYTGFQIGITISSLMGVVMVFSTILCSTYNSPVATSVTGNIKDVVLTVAGAILFHTQINTTGIIGISISFLGAFIYSYLKLKGKK